MSNNASEAKAVSKTKQWLDEVIIGLNFCPFAKKEFVSNKIDYHLCNETELKSALSEILARCETLEKNEDLETSLVIFTKGFTDFNQYLDLVDYATDLLIDNDFEGVFQLASFHPDYCFSGEKSDDPANFTNRSPLPIVHIIREESLTRVLSVYKNPENIPQDNIMLARSKGSEYFQRVLANIEKAHQ